MTVLEAPRLALTRPDAGMPPLALGSRPLSYFEFWPSPIFYAPVALMWVWFAARYRGLTLPTAANPGLPAGGFVGESKSKVLAAAGPIARAHISPFIKVLKRSGHRGDEQALTMALEAMSSAGLAFPVVAKPDMSCRGAGVQVMRDEAALARYVVSFPADAAFLIQRLVDKEGEAGIFYIRDPASERGDIPSLTLKYFPHVIGDGKRTLAELIRADSRAGTLAHLYEPRHAAQLGRVLPAGERFRLVFAGNHARGTIFRNGTRLVTPALRDRIDTIAKDIDGFYFGRFDVRFSDFDAFLAGDDLTIIEVNGAGAEMTHIWDKDTKLSEAYAALFKQYGSAFRIGAQNRRLGHPPLSIPELIRFWWAERRLTAHYPLTD